MKTVTHQRDPRRVRRRRIELAGLPVALCLAACPRPAPDEVADPPIDLERADEAPTGPPVFQVSWGDSFSVFDVLPRDDTAIARVQVARRSASLSGQVSVGDVGLARTCGDRYCVDGLQSIDTKSAIAFQPQTFVATKLTADERERLGDGVGSWLERGVRPLFVGPDAISYVTATAWFTQGAASSNADLACSTHRRGEAKATTLEGLWGSERANAALQAARSFLAAQRELDDRAHDLSPPDPRNVLLGIDGALDFCLPHQTLASSTEMERVHLVPSD